MEQPNFPVTAYTHTSTETACPKRGRDLSGKVFTFPMESDQVHVKLIPNMNKSLHSATVCLRFFSDLHRDQKLQPGVYEMYVLGSVSTFWGLADGLNEWASACAAWLSDTGLAQLWMNGKPGARKPLDPDNYGRGFDAKQSFVGLVTDVRVWDHALSPHDIYHFTQDSMFSPGNILKWSDLQYSKQGYGVVEDKQNLVSQTGRYKKNTRVLTPEGHLLSGNQGHMETYSTCVLLGL
ncbi:serum amyloid P-component-like, partial [Scleropages formosus]